MLRSLRSIVVALVLCAVAGAAAAATLSLTVVKAEVGSDKATGQPVITITFDAASTEAFAAFTAANIGRQTVVRVDGEEIMRPIIREPILKGTVQVSGNMTKEDAAALARRLTEGATIDVELVED